MSSHESGHPADQVDIIEHVAARGYVKEVHWPDVDVVLESGTGITAPMHRIFSASLFWAQGLLNAGDRFVYRITESNGELATEVLPDPDAYERSPEEIDAMIEGLMENARRDFASMNADLNETMSSEVMD